MNQSATLRFCIDEVSRDIGIGKDTLRLWERRYGFPVASQGPGGERCYSKDQVQRLRVISRLLERGLRPGKVVTLPPDQLEALARANQLDDVNLSYPAVEQLLQQLQTGTAADLESHLYRLLDEQGPQRFVTDIAAPLLDATGRTWAAGQLPVYLEHLITDHLSRVLHDACHRLQPPETGPRVLLTTLPGERHAMGLQMVELMLRVGGARTINLGVETPTDELSIACEQLLPEVLAISFSALQKRALLMASLRELCDSIPEQVQILVGGEGVCRLRLLPGRVTVVSRLDAIAPAVAAIHDRFLH